MKKYFDHDAYRFGTARLISRHGQYPIPVTCEGEQCPDAEVCHGVGADRGIPFPVAT